MQDRVKELIRIKGSELIHDDRNFRRHPASQKKALTAMLERIGIADAVLVRETDEGYVLIDGHLRADLMPDESVPALVVDVDESEAGELLATIDPLAAMAVEDKDALARLTETLDEDFQAMYKEAFDPDTTTEYELPDEHDLPAEGEAWTLHEGDCVDHLKQYEGQADLVITSPPYGDMFLFGENGNATDWHNIADAIVPTLKEGGVLVWITADETIDGELSGLSFEQALHFKKRGLLFHDNIIFHKTQYRAFGWDGRHNYGHEYMLVFSKGKPKTVNIIKDVPTKHAGELMYGKTSNPAGATNKLPPVVTGELKSRTNVWTYSLPNNESETSAHPARFPVHVATDHITTWTNPGDLVIDPMAGSGTAMKMAVEAGRRAVGIEIEPGYCRLIREYMSDAE